ncbi:unnamed protein product [Arabis nemorensis]|uniref:Uncharacterized protein n=1 Tax=Arabis nemorensis TaxID=586526 RepID=A0A565BKD8_9BRAS|nr:unnamed protein product [Arabis nemorensis]
MFYQQDIDLMLRKKPVISQNDYWIWKYNRSGDYSVKSGNRLANRDKHQDLIREAAAQPSLNGIKDDI